MQGISFYMQATLRTSAAEGSGKMLRKSHEREDPHTPEPGMLTYLVANVLNSLKCPWACTSLAKPGLLYMGKIGLVHCHTSSCFHCSPQYNPTRLQKSRYVTWIQKWLPPPSPKALLAGAGIFHSQ